MPDQPLPTQSRRVDALVRGYSVTALAQWVLSAEAEGDRLQAENTRLREALAQIWRRNGQDARRLASDALSIDEFSGADGLQAEVDGLRARVERAEGGLLAISSGHPNPTAVARGILDPSHA